jgi:hypothetical protein
MAEMMLSNLTRRLSPAGAHQSSAVPRNGRIDQVTAHLSQALEGACVVEADQAAVSGHVGIDDGDQSASMIRQDSDGLIAQIRNHRE